MLEKLGERYERLKKKKKDIENSLQDLANVTANAEQALAEIRVEKNYS